MKAMLTGEAFNRLVWSVLAFASKSDNRPCNRLIHILFSAEECKATAYALDGYRAGKKSVVCCAVDEDYFDVMISPPRIKAARKSVVEVYRDGSNSFVSYGDIIFRTESPGGEACDVEKIISGEANKPNKQVFGVNADYMIDALKSLKESGAAIGKPVVIEFTSPLSPILLHTDKDDNYKMVLPVRLGPE